MHHYAKLTYLATTFQSLLVPSVPEFKLMHMNRFIEEINKISEHIPQ